MRVAVVSRWYPHIGDERAGLFVRDQVEVLRRRVEVSVLVPKELPLRRFIGGWFTREPRVDPMPLALPPPGPIGRVLRGRAYARALRRLPWQPSLVHVHLLAPDALPVLRYCARRGIPLVVTEHATYLPELLGDARAKAQIQEVIEGADAVIVVGSWLASVIAGLRPDAPLHVIGNVIDTDFFSPSAKPLRRHVVMVAPTLDERKGVDVLLEAWRLIADRVGLPLVLVGDDPDGLAARLVARLGLAGRVELRGSLGRDKLRETLRDAAVYVCASRSETFGVAVAEALACGVPAVCTRCGGPESFVTDAVGVVVPKGDPVALADAVLKLLAATPRFAADALHRQVAEQFGPDAFSARMLDLYQDVLARRAGGIPDRSSYD